MENKQSNTSTSHRMTRQRQVILEELRKVKSHPTADEIYGIVRRKLPKISMGTVYRNLEVLSERGMVTKLEFGGNQKRFDGDTAHHYHVRCIKCGRVEDVHASPPQNLENTINNSEFKILGHRLEFTGLCPPCNNHGPE